MVNLRWIYLKIKWTWQDSAAPQPTSDRPTSIAGDVTEPDRV